MRRATIPDDAVVLLPRTEDDLCIGVGRAAEPGKLQAHITIQTADWGVFVIPLTATHLGMLSAVGKTLLTLTAEQAAELHTKLEDNTHE
jgi:hypothetical protein